MENNYPSKEASPAWSLLPPPAECCQECGVVHAPEQAHNKESLYYQYAFYHKHGRWPTWADAIAHCPPDLQKMWRERLEQHGVKFPK